MAWTVADISIGNLGRSSTSRYNGGKHYRKSQWATKWPEPKQPITLPGPLPGQTSAVLPTPPSSVHHCNNKGRDDVKMPYICRYSTINLGYPAIYRGHPPHQHFAQRCEHGSSHPPREHVNRGDPKPSESGHPGYRMASGTQAAPRSRPFAASTPGIAPTGAPHRAAAAATGPPR